MTADALDLAVIVMGCYAVARAWRLVKGLLT